MPDVEAVELLRAVFDAGVTFWDSAEAYKCEMPDGSEKFNETGKQQATPHHNLISPGRSLRDCLGLQCLATPSRP